LKHIHEYSLVYSDCTWYNSNIYTILGCDCLNLISKIQNSSDLRKLSFDELNMLAEEIRAFLIEHVSNSGGHLASNLGVVELTLAIHNVFDTDSDRLVFDVGHQSYVHKILTGRRDSFHTLRTMDGIAGFPKPSESIHDAFTAGHASSAVSVALGMARARTSCGHDYHVIAVVGDGAMTGGLFYEGMNDAGASHEPLIVILNDNGMSISQNVGGISRHLSLLRLKPGYVGFKKLYRRVTRRLPGGKALYHLTHRIKERLKQSLIGTTIFEEMGFLYLGPVDGHDIAKMSYLLERAKEEKRPVLLHVITKKGKGYKPAEDTPAEYHGVGAFDPETGIENTPGASFSAIFGETLCELAENHTNICALTAGMPGGTGLNLFAEAYPDRFFDVGIAEGHAVSMAAGMAKQGLIPVFAVYSTFLQRSYDMVLQDLALQKLHAVLAVDRAGLVGPDGETHHGVFDVSFLRDVPGMTVFAPCNYAELRSMLTKAVLEVHGPVAIRYPRGAEGEFRDAPDRDLIRIGSDITIVTYGMTVNAVWKAADILEKAGIHAELLKLRQLKPFLPDEVFASVRKTGRLLVVEEVNSNGCMCDVISKLICEAEIPAAIHSVNLGDAYIPHGSTKELLNSCGLNAESIAARAVEVFHFGK